MNIKNLCAPALIYIIFSLIQVIIDITEGVHAVALVKLFVGVIFTYMLQVLCESGLDVISWIIVFIPFILKSVVVGFLITKMNMNPYSGNIRFAHIENEESVELDAREKSELDNTKEPEAFSL
jgi:predicted membrane protein